MLTDWYTLHWAMQYPVFPLDLASSHIKNQGIITVEHSKPISACIILIHLEPVSVLYSPVTPELLVGCKIIAAALLID